MSLGGSNPSPSARRSARYAQHEAARKAAARAFQSMLPSLSSPSLELAPETPRLWTIGHGRSLADEIRALLIAQEVELVVDVRAVPYSRWALWARRETMPNDLAPIEYTWMGDTLGAKGILDWGARFEAPDFQWGVDHLIELARARRTAMLCAESKPDECHRRALIGRALLERGVGLVHILHDGRTWVEAPKAGPAPPSAAWQGQAAPRPAHR